MNQTSPKQSLTRWAYRYLSGRALDGVHRTNSTYLHPGTKVLHPAGRASKWAHRPGWQRQLYRQGVAVTAAGAGYAYVQAPEWTLYGAGAAGLVLTTRAGLKARRAWRTRQHTRHYVKPTAAVLGQLLQQDLNTPRGWLHIPQEMTSGDDATLADRVALPAWLAPPEWAVPALAKVRKLRRRKPRHAHEGWALFPPSLIVSAELKRTVRETLLGKLGQDDLSISWHQQGAEPSVRWTLVPRPPEYVGWDDLAPVLRGTGESAPIMGLGVGGKPVSIDLDAESPHVALSCASGAGKSIWGRAIIAQLLHTGAQVVILDGKRVSQAWCKDLPGVTYLRTGEEMHRVLLDLSAEMDRRYQLIDATPAEQEDALIASFPRIVAFFEEQGIGMQLLRDYWQEIKTKSDPALSPAIRAYRFLLQGGRQAKMHIISIAQLFTVHSTGGDPTARENYSSRILARATRQAWVMLAPEIGPPFPRQSKRRGRMHLVMGGEATEFQAVFLTIEQARQWATAGVVTVPVMWPKSVPDQRHPEWSVTSGRFYTLAQAAREHVIPLSYGSLRNAKSEAKEHFPEGREINGVRKWSEAELKTWHQNRSKTTSIKETEIGL